MKTLITYREGFTIHDMILEKCRRLGLEPSLICETSQWNFMMEMVWLNQEITILPQSHFNEMDHQHLQLKMLPLIEPQINWHLGIAWRKDSYLSYATRTWIEFLKKALER